MRSHDLQARDSGREDSRLKPPFRSLAKSSSLREKERYRSKESRVEKTESKWPRFDLSRHREAASTKGEKRTGWIRRGTNSFRPRSSISSDKKTLLVIEIVSYLSFDYLEQFLRCGERQEEANRVLIRPTYIYIYIYVYSRRKTESPIERGA